MTAIKVKVLTPSVKKEGSFKDDSGESREYAFKQQQGVLIRGEFREPYVVRIPADQADYPAGDYELDVENMLSIRNGKLQMDKNTMLKPLATTRATT